MTSTLQLQRRWRRIVPVLVIVLGLLLISAVIIQQAAAQDSGTLKPPFKLNRAKSAPSFDLHGPVALPLSAPIIMSQTFNSTYSPTTTLSAPGWHESYIAGASSQITWKYAGMAPLTDTVWSAGSSLLNPATGTYTNGQQALLIYGPLDLRDYTQLVMTGTYWLDTAAGDYLGVAYSTDGTNWNELYAQGSTDPGLLTAHTFYASLNQVARKPQVWFALTFVSNDDNQLGRGAFIRDVVLRGNPAYKIFMPLIRLDPTPTPVPVIYRKDYTFGNGAVDNPEFLEWGGNKSTDCGSGAYNQNVTNLGNPSGAMVLNISCLGTSGTGVLGGASPNILTAVNYEYSADILLVNGQKDARFGLIFSASTSTFGSNPPFDPNRNYYKLKLKISASDRGSVSVYQLQQCTNGNVCAVLFSDQPFPFPVNAGAWHNFKIRQQGSTITVYLDGTQLYSAGYDTNWGNDRREFGLYVEARGTNNEGGPLEIRFDNVRVKDLP